MRITTTITVIGLVLSFFLGSAKPNYFNDDLILKINKIEIQIDGISTVGKYNCANMFSKKDTIFFYLNKKNSAKVEIPMSTFDCGNKMMTKDLLKTVKSDEFPNSYVTFSDLKSFSKNYKCDLTFVIANKTLKFKDFILLNKTNNKIEGNINLTFTDLGLKAPVKMAGLIKVKDEINISFSLYKN
ncbi:hypothetical protein OIU83_12105 [Flavobacterium sp. LS1R49]|uniref:Lipid/polyisoprenoid-binding YceI-like domain-containing protein n=1 Tax=Flavobacterium shii TaxID=2987687 RepID=A0A9X2ZC87_9FLAO|nr:YceI family protein [Flavobacterium shii]MCV9928404.1 hypothetical protein [Flavobacterium shii]